MRWRLCAHACARDASVTFLLSLCVQSGSGQGRASFSPSPTHLHGGEGGVICAGRGADMDLVNLYFCHSLFPEKRKKVKPILSHNVVFPALNRAYGKATA